MSQVPEFVLPNPVDAGRLWLMDLIHSPRALPPLSADLNDESTARTPLEMDALTINGYSYRSPRSMGGPPPLPPALPPGEALRNWETVFLPACQAAYARFRDQDFSSMSGAEVLAFLENERPALLAAFFNTIVSAMQLGPDADRLYTVLEQKLGSDADLLSATILHGGGSETRSLGREVDALADAARETPAARDALLARDFARALAVTAEPWRGSLATFLRDHEDEIALWSEIHEPPWSEDPASLLRLIASLLSAPRTDRTDKSAAAIAEVRSRLAPEDLPEFEEAVRLSRDYVPIIEHRARWQLKMVGGMRRAFVALGNDLVAHGLADSPDDIWFLHLAELEPAIHGALDVRSLAKERRAEWRRNLTLEPPMTLGLPVPYEMLGQMSPMLRRMFGAVAVAAPTATVVSGIPASAGVVRGRARVVGSLSEADELEEGDILVCPSTSPPWSPYFGIVAAVVTDAGGVISHAAIEAREYGIPAVVGTREGTRRIPDRATITVDGAAGTITIEP